MVSDTIYDEGQEECDDQLLCVLTAQLITKGEWTNE